MTNQEYQALCSKYPDLTFEGFGVNMEHAEGKTYQEYFAMRRRELEEAFQEFSYCLEWLQTHDIDGKQSAHHLKDKVQFTCVPPHTYTRGERSYWPLSTAVSRSARWIEVQTRGSAIPRR